MPSVTAPVTRTVEEPATAAMICGEESVVDLVTVTPASRPPAEASLEALDVLIAPAWTLSEPPWLTVPSMCDLIVPSAVAVETFTPTDARPITSAVAAELATSVDSASSLMAPDDPMALSCVPEPTYVSSVGLAVAVGTAPWPAMIPPPGACAVALAVLPVLAPFSS